MSLIKRSRFMLKRAGARTYIAIYGDCQGLNWNSAPAALEVDGIGEPQAF